MHFFPANNNNTILCVVEVGRSKLKDQDLILRGTCHVGLDAGCSSVIFFFFEANPLAGLILNCMPLVLLLKQGKMVSLNVIKKTVLHFAS